MRKTFHCIDAHTCGNPVRVVAGGGPFLRGENMMERRMDFINNHDWIRKGLMFEPRGHDLMSGSIIYPASDPDNDAGILFIETSGCLPMCGHGTIGTVTVAIEEGLIQPKSEGKLRLETPAGLIQVEYTKEGNKVKKVKLTNVASFLALSNVEVNSSYLGKLKVDISYGGNFYAIIDPQENFPGMEKFSASQLIDMSLEIRNWLRENIKVSHPLNPGIEGVSHVMWTGEKLNPSSTARNAVFYGDKAIDRSPCGTGTSARMAQWYSKGMLKLEEAFIHESIIGSAFTGRIEKSTKVDETPAIIPSIEGWAKITGYNTIIIDDEDDPYAHGFQVI